MNPSEFSKLIATIESENPEWAAKAYHRLLELILGEDTRAAVLELLESHSEPMEDLIQLMNSEERWVSNQASNLVAEIGSIAVPSLLKALQADSPDLRAGAASVLGRIGERAAIPSLEKLTGDQETSVRVAAIRALGWLAGVSAIPRLIDHLKDPDPDVASALLYSFKLLGEPAVEPLIQHLRGGDDISRHNAVRALCQLKGQAGPRLLEALHEEDETVRSLAAEVLGSGGYEGKESLLGALDDPIVQVRRSAARALGELGGPGVLEALRGMLERRSEPARDAAADAILKLRVGPDRGRVLKVVETSLTHEHAYVRQAMVRSIERYMKQLDQSKWNVWTDRYYGFGDYPHWLSIQESQFLDGEEVELPAMGVVKRILQLTYDPDKRVREAAASTLHTLQRKLKAKRREPAVVYESTKKGGGLGRRVLYAPWMVESLMGLIKKGLNQAARELPKKRYADFSFYQLVGRRRNLVDTSRPLRAGERYLLEVAVRVRPIGLSPWKEKRRPLVETKQMNPETIFVTAESEGDRFEIEQPVQTLVLPPQGDSVTNAHFAVRPTRASGNPRDLARLRVRLYCKLNLLEVVQINAEVLPSFERDVMSRFGLKPCLFLVQERLEREYFDTDALAPRAMHVDVTRSRHRYVLTFAVGDEQEERPQVRFSGPIGLQAEDLEDQLARIRDLWTQIVRSEVFVKAEAKEGELRPYLLQLAIMGRRLWRLLFRFERKGALFHIGSWLEENPLGEGSIVQVSVDDEAADFVFPWALLFDRRLPENEFETPDLRGFWGIRYALEQQLPGVSVYLDEAVERSSGVLDLAFMAWDRFANFEDQKRQLAEMAARSSGRLEVSEPPVTSAKDCKKILAGSDAGIVYFYTHGYTRPRRTEIAAERAVQVFLEFYKSLAETDERKDRFRWQYDELSAASPLGGEDSWIKLTYGKVCLSELYDEILELRGEPLVVLNMCESACVSPSLRESFIHFFLDRGARAVVGTECPMTIEFAHPFVIQLFERLFEGDSIGVSLLKTRRYFVERMNPLGLAYDLFGSATLRFEPPVMGESLGSNNG